MTAIHPSQVLIIVLFKSDRCHLSGAWTLPQPKRKRGAVTCTRRNGAL